MAKRVGLFTAHQFNFLGVNGATGAASFIDESPYKLALGVSGTPRISTAQSKFGGSSLLLNGAGDFISPAVNPMLLYKGDLTVEAWIYKTKAGYGNIICTYNGTGAGWDFWVTATDQLAFNISNGAYNVVASAASSVPLNQWVHVAGSLDGATLRVFVDGVLKGTLVTNGTPMGTVPGGSTIGRDPLDTTRDFGGYIDSVRVVSNYALYTTNFTPPTVPFALVDATPMMLVRKNVYRVAFPTQRTFYTLDGKRMPLPTGILGLLPSTNPLKPSPAMRMLDWNYGGLGIISGTVKEAGTPDMAVRRRVRLHLKSTGAAVRDTFSAVDGTYQFKWLNFQTFYVVSFDHTGNYNAVIKDSIIPEKIT